MNIIELIFSNPLFIILALGLINYLVGQGKKGKTENKPNNERKQSEHIPKEKSFEQEQRQQTRNQGHFEEPKPFVEFETDINEQSLSIEELRQQQLERLSIDLQSDVTANEQFDQQDQSSMQTVQSNSKNKRDFKNKQENYNLKGRVTKNGLMESIVMSEVLGPPRARKRYNNNRL